MLASCSETFNATRALQGGMMAAQALSLSDEQVQAYVHQYITQLDAKSKVLPESNAYTKRLRNLTKGLVDVEGVPLNFKVYQENQVNAFACADGSVRVYTGIMDVMTDKTWPECSSSIRIRMPRDRVEWMSAWPMSRIWAS